MKVTLLISSLFLVISGLMAITGYGTTSQVNNDTADPSLSILSPTGGEEWYIGETHDITWTASDTNILYDNVNIWYSLTGDTNYQSLIEGTANDGIHSWALPSVESDNTKVRIRVSDSFGNIAQHASASPFSITYIPPLPPAGVTVNTSNSLDAVITWEAVTQSAIGLPMTPDGYIVLYNESPYEHDEHFYYYLGETSTELSFTHYNVVRRRAQMFYSVIAFKDYRGEMASILSDARQHPDQPLSLADLKLKQRQSCGGGK